MSKDKINKLTTSEKEELIKLRQENLYLRARLEYEKKLEAHFLDMLSSQGAVPSPVRGGFLTLLCDQHQHYLNETPGIDTDTRFALHVAPLAFSLFVLRRNAFQKLMEEIA